MTRYKIVVIDRLSDVVVGPFPTRMVADRWIKNECDQYGVGNHTFDVMDMRAPEADQ